MNNSIPSRFYSLDVIRGLAAMTVVLWHWQHLLYGEDSGTIYRMTDQPFYNYLYVFYQWGWMAVDFFFSLSGFVFFWLYADAVSSRKMGGWTFFVMRFSRLYPLHFVTFIFVLVAQWWIFKKQGHYFIYQYNDFYHAVLNVFMASDWGIQRGLSFNSPVWSVSVEVILYAVFFGACLNLKRRTGLLTVMILFGCGLLEVDNDLGRGVFSFFVGGAVFSLYKTVRVSKLFDGILCVSIIATLLMWFGIVWEVSTGALTLAAVNVLSFILPEHLHGHIAGIIYRGGLRGVTGILFPMTILSLALLETRRGYLGRRLSFLGHLSYSSYLLHFPLQICFFVGVGWLGVDRGFFYSRLSLILFVGLLIPICFVSYYFFELPMQRKLRNALSPRVPVVT